MSNELTCESVGFVFLMTPEIWFDILVSDIKELNMSTQLTFQNIAFDMTLTMILKLLNLRYK